MEEEPKSQQVVELGQQASTTPKDIYAPVKPERRYWLGKRRDFAVGFFVALIICPCCLSTFGLTLLLVPALRRTDEFKKYPEITNGMMFGLAVILSVMAVVLIRIGITYMHDKRYW